MEKKALRQKLLRRLKRRSPKVRSHKSLKIARTVRRLSWYRKAGSILCYAAIPGEVETESILREALADGKIVAVPVVVKRGRRLIAAEIKSLKDLTPRGVFGILEPAAGTFRRVKAADLDLVLVPGVAFSRDGRRLGRGSGFFDRFLEKLPRKIHRVGLAFDEQILAEIPVEKYDQRVDLIVTEKEVIAR